MHTTIDGRAALFFRTEVILPLKMSPSGARLEAVDRGQGAAPVHAAEGQDVLAQEVVVLQKEALALRDACGEPSSGSNSLITYCPDGLQIVSIEGGCLQP